MKNKKRKVAGSINLSDVETKKQKCENVETKCLIQSALQNGQTNYINEQNSSETVQQKELESKLLEHFHLNMGPDIGKTLQNSSIWRNEVQNWNALGRVQIGFPDLPSNHALKITEPHTFATSYMSPKLQYYLNRKKLKKCQQEILSVLKTYANFYYGEATLDKLNDIRIAYSLHLLNHVIMSQRIVFEHNTGGDKDAKSHLKSSKDKKEAQLRDQGLTRPRVLVLLPFKSSAYKLVNLFIKLLKSEKKDCEISNEEKLKNFYGPTEEDKTSGSKQVPKDFQELFEGNSEEDFMMGIAIKKNGLKLFSDFYKSDIIVGSALSMKMKVGSPDDKEYEPEFLSSIEILIVDQADVILMQNWMHLVDVEKSINSLPTKLEKITAPLNRVRPEFTNNTASYYRQTIVLSAIHADLCRSFFLRCLNSAGKFQVLNHKGKGHIEDVDVECELILTQIPPMLKHTAAEARFSFFVNSFFKQLQKKNQFGTLLYVYDYCDYLNIVHHIKNDGGMSVSTINEYMLEEPSQIAKAKSEFFRQQRKLIVITGRFHFYKRNPVKGASHIVFYSLPAYGHFVPEICGWMKDEYQKSHRKFNQTRTVDILFQKEDCTQLIDIFGSKKAQELLASRKTVHICQLNF